MLGDPDECAQFCGDFLHDAEVVEHYEVGGGAVSDRGKEPAGESLRRNGIDTQRQPRLPASRMSTGGGLVWGISPVCGEPTFQIRIVVAVCACGVARSSAANAVHANMRNMRASWCS